MKPEEIKIGMRVKISRDISETDRCLSSNEDMIDMSKSGETYEITDTHHSNRYGVLAIIKGWQWMPCDLTSIDEGSYKEPIHMKGKKQLFDPEEL